MDLMKKCCVYQIFFYTKPVNEHSVLTKLNLLIFFSMWEVRLRERVCLSIKTNLKKKSGKIMGKFDKNHYSC